MVSHSPTAGSFLKLKKEVASGNSAEGRNRH
jgi:hypothetical protein